MNEIDTTSNPLKGTSEARPRRHPQTLGLLAVTGMLWACIAPGCGAPPSPRPSPAEQQVGGSKIYHKWYSIYDVRIDGAVEKRVLKGYLDHQFSLEDPEGIQFVLDEAHRRVGFVLPSGKAYVYEKDDSGEHVAREVNPVGAEIRQAVRSVLDLAGEVVLVEVSATSPTEG